MYKPEVQQESVSIGARRVWSETGSGLYRRPPLFFFRDTFFLPVILVYYYAAFLVFVVKGGLVLYVCSEPSYSRHSFYLFATVN